MIDIAREMQNDYTRDDFGSILNKQLITAQDLK